MKWPRGAFENSLSAKHIISTFDGGEKPLKLLSFEGRRRHKKYASLVISALQYTYRAYRLVCLVSLIYTSILVFNLPLLLDTHVSHLFGLYVFCFCAQTTPYMYARTRAHARAHTHIHTCPYYIHMCYMITIPILYGVVG